MRVSYLYTIFFILSILLLTSTLIYSGKQYRLNNKKVTINKVQSVSHKDYPKRRKELLHKYSLESAEKEIDRLLKDEPIDFNEKNNSIEDEYKNGQLLKVNRTKVVLNKILKILNHLEEDMILSIETHANEKASADENLILSQKRADILKNYFREKSTIPLIVAIGYGAELPDRKNSRKNIKNIKINLKRIK